jgi:hypothetical protein
MVKVGVIDCVIVAVSAGYVGVLIRLHPADKRTAARHRATNKKNDFFI